MTKEEVQSKLIRVPFDMPLFLLLGSDPCAQFAILAWMAEARKREVPMTKILKAGAAMGEMAAYQPKKIPD